MKAAIIVLSDPKSGSEDALGRVFNGLAAAHDFKSQGDEVTLLFHGPGTRWPGVLSDPDHPANRLWESVKDTVAGVSCACSEVFGAQEEAVQAGLELVKDNSVPDTSGLPSLRGLAAEGFTILTF